MLDGLMDTIKGSLGDKLTGELNMDSNQADGVVDTIKGFISSTPDAKDQDEESLGNGLMSALGEKNGLTSDIASKVKDLAMPLIMSALGSGLGDALKGGIGGAASKLGGLFK